MLRTRVRDRMRVVANGVSLAVLLLTFVVPSYYPSAVDNASITDDDSLTANESGAHPARHTSIEFWVTPPAPSSIHPGPRATTAQPPSQFGTLWTSDAVRSSSPRAPPFFL